MNPRMSARMGDITKFTKTTTQPNGNTSQTPQPSTFDAQGMQPMQCSMMGINPSALGITPTGYPHFDPLTWAMASNTMKGPFMQFLPGPPVMPRGGSTYGSPIASAPTDSCRNSMKSTRRENDTEVMMGTSGHIHGIFAEFISEGDARLQHYGFDFNCNKLV
ncbi:uncharacterized protein LOC109850761 isoform X2 [Asparagus officinalis]|nr:uncharacterized protein LOC109850761 isoform X2 [Asparagus officinalis]XP_020276421.1 uncharacterized protein LOC109850761 isoform X2 [Asparagus officinalis]